MEKRRTPVRLCVFFFFLQSAFNTTRLARVQVQEGGGCGAYQKKTNKQTNREEKKIEFAGAHYRLTLD